MSDTVLLQFACLERPNNKFVYNNLQFAWRYSLTLNCLFFNTTILTSIHLFNLKCMFDTVVTDDKTFTTSR